MSTEQFGSYISLATFKRDGSEVRTPVWYATRGQRMYVFTESEAWKVRWEAIKLLANVQLGVRGRAALLGRVEDDDGDVRAAAQADEAPVTEVEIAVAAMVNEEEGFQEELDKVQDEVSELAQIESTVVGSSAVVTTGLSVGYVVWLARGGLLIASLLSSMPAWRAIDPLPVLASFRDNDDEEDEESLDALVRKGGAGNAAKPTHGPSDPDGIEPDMPLDDGATT